MLEMHREITSAASEAVQSASAAARLFAESLQETSNSAQGQASTSDDVSVSKPAKEQPSGWLSFDFESLYGKEQQAESIARKIKEAAANNLPADKLLNPNATEYVEGDKLAIERINKQGDMEGRDQMGTKFTVRADGTTMIENMNGDSIKVTKDGHATVTRNGVESYHNLNNGEHVMDGRGNVTYRLPDGTSIVRKHDKMGNETGTVISQPGQSALETFNGENRVLWGRSLRK